MDIFELLRSGADVDMATPEYGEAILQNSSKILKTDTIMTFNNHE